ncbi:lymphotoxin-alpha-like [Stegostoma tigrinum]|uniref:lymphotoxin-alpha-like n=1 Tax=Stegostoma tigrinum TaxID=3053191 RepID=UPI00202B304F|nr:lymphotoxin-alpha-like [Stegostoma tigrinum]
MSSEKMLSELESGKELASGNTQQSTRCLKLLSAFAVIALVAGCGYLLFTQGQSSTSSLSNWKTTLRGADDVPANSGLPHLMKRVGSDPRPRIAAHLTANPIPLVSDKLTWQEQAGIAFSYGVEFSNNSLLIKKPGFYFIYTQVVFHNDQCEESTIFLSHDVHKLSLAYPEETILLRATKSVCHHGSHSDPWFKTSYQGAIFEFEAGDRIFSRVSESVVKYLDKTEGKTFFGIFAL